MRSHLRFTATVLLILSWAFAHAQEEEGTGHERERPRHFDAGGLREGNLELPGQGQQIPGIDLRTIGRPRIAFIDDSAFAARDLDDNAWPQLHRAEDSLVPGVHIWWVRYHLYPDAGLKRVPLVLSVGSSADVEVFLNGSSILRTTAMPTLKGAEGMPLADSLPHVSAPFKLLCDDHREVLALRVTGLPGRTLKDAGLMVSMHRPDVGYGAQRTVMHFGLFVGVNLIILVLSVILWFQDRRETSWLMLGLLSLIEAFDSVIGVAGEPDGVIAFPATDSGAKEECEENLRMGGEHHHSTQAEVGTRHHR